MIQPITSAVTRPLNFVLTEETALCGAVHMAIDRAFLERAELSPEPVTWVRLYRWSHPTVSLGRNQGLDSVDLSFCTRNGIAVVRRPTGGRAVFHGGDLTYSVISNDESLFPVGSADATYLLIASILQGALADAGIETIVSRGAPSATRGAKRARGNPGVRLPCFASTARHELITKGKKIAGSAQRRLRRSFLQHGSIPIRIDFEQMAGALGVPACELATRITSVSECSPVDFPGLARTLTRHFQEFLFSGKPRSAERTGKEASGKPPEERLAPIAATPD